MNVPDLDIVSTVALEILNEEGTCPTQEEIAELIRCGIFHVKDGNAEETGKNEGKNEI